jgi:peptidoglycan/xylan/chitin deacetylase (PgdA/CDA1 family)
VSDEDDELAVQPRRFREQMDFLASEGYRVIDVTEAAAVLDLSEPTGKVLGLSFDDGYRDIAENALAILEHSRFRASVFVPTDVIDGSARFSFYRKQPELLGWDEIVGLDRAGTFRFESHTATHPNLLRLGDEEAREEIRRSKLGLEERIERPVGAFAYPGGLFGEREKLMVREAGFRAAVSCEPGVNLAQTDRLALHRIQIDARDRLLDFRAKLGGGHDTSPRVRSLYRRWQYGLTRPRSHER